MIDRVALEEVICFHLCQNCLLGLCCEHSQDIAKTVDIVGDIEWVKCALDDGECHWGKDVTVLAIAPIKDYLFLLSFHHPIKQKQVINWQNG